MAQDRHANLIKNKDLSPEELRAISTQGAKAANTARRRRKAMREIARTMLDTELRANDELRGVLADRGFEDYTEAAAILLAQLNKARNGDTEAAKFIRDTSGQRPADQVAIGNIDDKPFESLDLSSLSDAALQRLINARSGAAIAPPEAESEPEL
jgi:hypothetical protein|nr:MAG TPA: hypothetical protein [Caudoviricetes sp.]